METSQVEWVRANAMPFQLTVDGDDDFSDLQPLKTLIGKAHIVQLGEQSHGDGACFQAKIRLIQFLHQEMGFDVLAFESGLYDCERANESLRTELAPLEAAQQGVFGIWTGCREVAPLWDYLAEHSTSQRPLDLTGFDCQFTGQASAEHFVADLKSIASRCGATEVLRSEENDESLDEFFSQLERLVTQQEFSGSKNRWMRSLHRVMDSIAKASGTGDTEERELIFWRQQLRSLRAFAEYSIPESPEADPDLSHFQLNARDAQMADNLIWLAEQRFPERRIIVWAASFHIMHNAAAIKVPDGSVDYSSIVPMGHLVYQKFGDDVFTIAFTAADGRAGAWFRTPFPIGTAPDGTLEDLCARAGLVHAIVPLRNLPNNAEWLSKETFARPLGYSWMRARWPSHFDAIVFQKTMQPATENR